MTSSSGSDSKIDIQTTNKLLYAFKKFASRANPVQQAESFLDNIINGNNNCSNEQLSFNLKIGQFEKKITADPSDLSLGDIRSLASDFIKELYPGRNFPNIESKLFFSIDKPNDRCLKQFNAISDITQDSYLIIDLSKLGLPDVNDPFHSKHDLDWNTYSSPTNCDLCSKLLIGYVICRQGKQCKRCKRNYHEDCSTKLSNDWCVPPHLLQIGDQTKTSSSDNTPNFMDIVKKGIVNTSKFLGGISDESDEDSEEVDTHITGRLTSLSNKP